MVRASTDLPEAAIAVNVVTTKTDTQTGAIKTYINNQGAPFQPIQDTNAFVCP